MGSSRVTVAIKKIGAVARAIDGTSALNAALPRASFRQVSNAVVVHAGSLRVLSRESGLIGKKFVGDFKKPLNKNKKVIRRRPWPKQSVRRIPLRTVPRR